MPTSKDSMSGSQRNWLAHGAAAQGARKIDRERQETLRRQQTGPVSQGSHGPVQGMPGRAERAEHSAKGRISSFTCSRPPLSSGLSPVQVSPTLEPHSSKNFPFFFLYISVSGRSASARSYEQAEPRRSRALALKSKHPRPSILAVESRIW